MADFICDFPTILDPSSRGYFPGQATGVHDRVVTGDLDGALMPTAMSCGGFVAMTDRVDGLNDYVAQEATDQDFFFFERIHYTPKVIELGNILTSTVVEIEIYNAFRDASQTFTSATANAGAGISFSGLPSLPSEIPAQNGAIFDVDVSTIGPPNIDGTLDFVTDPANISIPITGSRVVMFAYQPERPVVEVLEFMTDTIRAADGTEQRVSQRLNPRQQIEMTLRLIEGDERRQALTLLKGWHPRVFGIPIWWEARPLGADAATATDTITVDTAYMDLRVGSLAIVWSDSDYFDALQVASFDASSITFESNLTHDFDETTTLVMPLRVAHTEANLGIQRYLNALQDVKLKFHVIDNEVGDIADTAAFDEHNSKVLLDDPNLADGMSISDSLYQEIHRIDNRTAPISQFSTWDSSVPVTAKGFLGNSLQSIWEVRQLVHALRGSQVSFYLPTFYHDMIVVEDLASGSALMDIENIGYSDYINGVEPFKSIWVEMNDGTILTRQVISATIIDADTERLTVDSDWGELYDKDDIARVSFLRKVRIADDRVTFVHDLPGTAKIKMNVIGAP